MRSNFKDKEIYKKSKELYALIQCILDDKIPYYAKDQISRASMSIVLNFAEGYGRFHKNDKKQFYIHARASLNEVVACLDLLNVHTKTEPQVEQKILKLTEDISKMLSGLINSLKKSHEAVR